MNLTRVFDKSNGILVVASRVGGIGLATNGLRHMSENDNAILTFFKLPFQLDFPKNCKYFFFKSLLGRSG